MSDAPPRVCVVGDLLADTDVFGVVERLSPEAPVPVVDQRRVVHRPGGAGLVALLAARSGATVRLVAAVADDECGRRVRDLLRDEGVDLVAIPSSGSTPEKVRIRAGDHPLLRLDRGGGGAVSTRLDPVVDAAVDGALSDCDVVLVADYGRGVAGHPDVRSAIDAARRRGVPLVWDPHRNGSSPARHCTLVCPNRDEAGAFDAKLGTNDDGSAPRSDLARVVSCTRRLRQAWDVTAVATTLGSEGAVVVIGEGAPLRIPVLAPSTGTDTCGAGDAFAAAAAVAVGSGAVISEAVQHAVDAAARFVAAGAAANLSPPSSPPSRSGSDPNRDGRGSAGVLVVTGGCFDLLHAGHVHTLEAASRLGDRLVVLVNDDDSVRRLKGPDRPLQTAADRCAVLSSLAVVDEVLTFAENTPEQALRRLRPDVFVKGGDYTASELPEADVLAEWGGVVVTVPFLDGYSTTGLVARARSAG